MSIIYLACPYTHDDPDVRRMRAEAVNQVAGELIAGGEVVFSPISHSHAITEAGLPVDWEFWKKQSLAMLAVCGRLVVYCLDGWEKSVGVRAEIEAARTAGMDVEYRQPDRQHERTRRMSYSPFDNDPFDAVCEAVGKLWPNLYWPIIQWLPPEELHKQEGDPWGVTAFPDDETGDIIVSIDSSIPVAGAVEVLAHELAHVACEFLGLPGNDDHGEHWEACFEEINNQYVEIVEAKMKNANCKLQNEMLESP